METARQELHGADAEDEDKQAEAKAVGAQRNQEQCARISRKCLERGVIVRMINNKTVLSPCLVITFHQVQELVAAIGAAITETHAELVAEGLLLA